MNVCLIKARHFGHKGFVGTNPRIKLVTNKDEADYVWYHTVGDSKDVQKDLDAIAEMDKPAIVLITGDDKPARLPNGYIFGTCTGFNIPYEYDKFIPNYLNGWNPSPRIHLATFRGAKNTWMNRHKMEVDGVRVTWGDWWNTKENRPKLASDYVAELGSSVFSLCPRGNGRSSMRLMESMLLGAIPVRLDDWTKPFGNTLDFSPQFDLNVTAMGDVVEYMHAMSEKEIASRRAEMKKFVDEFLVIDYLSGCEGTIGYTEYIRRFIEEK